MIFREKSARISEKLTCDLFHKSNGFDCDAFHKLGFRETACDVFHKVGWHCVKDFTIRHDLLVIVFTIAGLFVGGVWGV